MEKAEGRDPSGLDPEKVAYWFFRLNGCLTIPNFVVHPDNARGQHTDADILAVRFPHRCELFTSDKPMRDHKAFSGSDRTLLAIAEVKKSGVCRLNGPWKRPEAENIHRVLYAVGAFEKTRVPDVATSLYRNGIYQNGDYTVRLFAVALETSDELRDEMSEVVQITWAEVIRFIHGRFRQYRRIKADHSQWDEDGKRLYDRACAIRESDFVDEVLTAMGAA